MRVYLGSVFVVGALACGEVANTPKDAATGSADAPDAMSTVQVATDGDDANDGLMKPVKTLKRAIMIATSNGAIKTISLAAGKYGAANGETYPYTVPANVTILGAAGGGSILAGTGAEEGLALDTGKVQNVELDDFGVAIRAAGTGTLDNVKVHTSNTAIVVEKTGKLTASTIEIVGTPGKCTNTALQATDTAALTITTLTIQTTGVALTQTGMSDVSIAKGAVTGDPACTAVNLMTVNAKSLTFTDTTMSGGDNGIFFNGGTTALVMTATTISDVKSDAIAGSVATANITGGELRNNGRAGIETGRGTWTLTNVGIKGNPVMGIYIQGSGAASPGTLVMRGCTISGNGNGIYMFDNAIGDLGTAASPGNNTFTGNANVGLDVDGNTGARLINAVGNTWKPNTQNANAQGKYAAGTIQGTVNELDGNNLAVNAGWTVAL